MSKGLWITLICIIIFTASFLGYAFGVRNTRNEIDNYSEIEMHKQYSNFKYCPYCGKELIHADSN